MYDHNGMALVLEKSVRFWMALTLLAALGACSSRHQGPAVAQRGMYKIGAPYTIDGVTYVPMEEFQHVETGTASWYGPGFHGKSTANGETYDQTDRTAAHRTLQMPSVLRVTNLDNGQSTIVRVNDRGPYARAPPPPPAPPQTPPVTVYASNPRSPAVAPIEASGSAGGDVPGTLGTGPPTVATIASSVTSLQAAGGFYVQTGAFSTVGNAEKQRGLVTSYGSTEISPASSGGREVYRVRLGPYSTQDAAGIVADRLKRSGYGDARVVAD